ncbi:hypothetical protein MC7420_5175 [Coleofasciculus chthonoplastes PCC 7420]|uniref:Uncharacterized protein n=1 Tax=Coleofasciculus chthonoplastes PCC 7420 TaxID=118168 RepID=B4W2N3_9CYAN|nr:hypothetical protein [Coleofasciculus chthonoplastes]EDX71550.1 hypothetical protein MC7420_5175 [Coleofasciculus chthonoplastes PCC 7420]
MARLYNRKPRKPSGLTKYNCLRKADNCLWTLSKTNRGQPLEASADEAGNPKDE